MSSVNLAELRTMKLEALCDAIEAATALRRGRRNNLPQQDLLCLIKQKNLTLIRHSVMKGRLAQAESLEDE